MADLKLTNARRLPSVEAPFTLHDGPGDPRLSTVEVHEMSTHRPNLTPITPPRPPAGSIRVVTLVIGAGAVLALLLLFMSGSTVQAGHVGVLLTFGRVEPGTLGPGFHMMMPGAQQI